MNARIKFLPVPFKNKTAYKITNAYGKRGNNLNVWKNRNLIVVNWKGNHVKKIRDVN